MKATSVPSLPQIILSVSSSYKQTQSSLNPAGGSSWFKTEIEWKMTAPKTEQRVAALCPLRGDGPWPEWQKGALLRGGLWHNTGHPAALPPKIISLPVIALAGSLFWEKAASDGRRKWLKKRLIHTHAMTAGQTEGKSDPRFRLSSWVRHPRPLLRSSLLHPDNNHQ